MTVSINPAEVREGDVIAGKYRVERILGVGGMGVVVAAQHLYLDERVAVKFLRPEALGNPETVARFAREAKAAVKIKSEHVARVIDVGAFESGEPFIVMEYLEGSDLSEWIHSRGGLPVEQAIEFVLQACEAIAEAHALGIVHRDLKPANLFVVRRPDGVLAVKVLDFGISKMGGLNSSGPEMGMTKTTAVMGSPYYMSPEQIQSARSADTRSDIWALGVILYELLVGQVPFGGDTMPELVLKIVSAPPGSVREVRADVPQGLEAVILRCLTKDREARFPNVAEFAAALAPYAPKRALPSIERAARVLEIAAQSLSGGEGPRVQRFGSTADSWGNTASSRAARGVRHRRMLVAAAAAALVAASGLALAVHFMRASQPVASTATGIVPTALSVAMPPAPSMLPAPTPLQDRAGAATEHVEANPTARSPLGASSLEPQGDEPGRARGGRDPALPLATVTHGKGHKGAPSPAVSPQTAGSPPSSPPAAAHPASEPDEFGGRL